jgi:hypothetical protein
VPPKPRRPVRRRCLTNDATTEAIAVLLSENPRGVALVRDELVAWTLSMNLYRGGQGPDRQFYQSTWSGTPIRLDRKSNPDGRPIVIPFPFLAVCGGVTPDMLGELADEEGRQDGFLDRILVAYPDPVEFAEWSDEGVSPAAEAGWRDAIEGLFRLRFERDDDGKLQARVLRLTPGAKAVWREFYNAWGREMADRGPLVGTWSKLRAYCARLALILQLLQEACGGPVTGEEDDDTEATEEGDWSRALGPCHDTFVHQSSMEGAVDLVHYFAAHAERVHAAMAGGAGPPRADDERTDRLVSGLVGLVGGAGGRWQGTAGALLEQLNGRVDEATRAITRWPADPAALSRVLHRVPRPSLEAAGLAVQFRKAPDKNRTRLILLEKASDASDASDADPTPCDAAGSGSDASSDGGPPGADAVRTGNGVPRPADARTRPGGDPSEDPSDAEVVDPDEVVVESDASDGRTADPEARDDSVPF